jgi:hypothetical protein
MEEPIRYGWLPLNIFDEVISEIRNDLIKLTGIIPEFSEVFVELSEERRYNASLILTALFKHDETLIETFSSGAISQEEILDSGVVICGLQLLSKKLRANGRKLITSPKSPFDLIFLADPKFYYLEVLEEMEPTE